MPELTMVLSREEIDRRVAEMAQRISEDYRDRHLVLIGVLKGAFIFLGDLARQLTIPVEIDFIQFSSYGNRDASSGNIRLRSDVSTEISGKDILVVEDIVDTGLTMKKLIPHLEALSPKSVKVCAFIDKRERRKVDYEADYVCHAVKGGFLVGYGLDYAEQYRNLPALYHLKL